MGSWVDELLQVAWPDGLPPRLQSLVDRELCASLAQDFKLGLVFPFEAVTRPSRLALSAQGERERWQTEVRRQWPSPALEAFLGRAPDDTRLMVDSDGSERAVIYLDDLHEVDHQLSAPDGQQLMCATLDLPEEREGQMSRHQEPPLSLLPDGLRRRLTSLLAAGAEGLWALRLAGQEIEGVVWISEARWRDSASLARVAASRVGDHPGYRAALDCLERNGRQGYPDALELRADGTIDLTLGIL